MATAHHPLRKTLTLAAALMLAAPAASAVNFGDMFNPGRWFGGDNDDYYYDDGPWGPYGPGAYGAPGYAPFGGFSPYGAPGYGAPGYGAPGFGAPGYGAPAYSAPVQQAPARPSQSPSASASAKDEEIEALKQRIEQLESRGAAPNRPPQRQPQGPRSGEGWPSAPTFRPMDQY